MKIRFLSILLATALLAAACGDDPFQVRWEEHPLEAVLYSLDREELSRPAAFNMIERRSMVVEDPGTGRWDFALERDGGQMVFSPHRLLGVSRPDRVDAGIAVLPGVAFADVREAPGDTLSYVTNAQVPVALGSVYVVRTHQQSGVFGQLCVYYGKVEPLEIDVEAGTLRFLHDVSPDCNNRSLVPPG